MNHKGISKVGFILLFFLAKNINAQYNVVKLGPEINSDKYDEISPVITRDGHTLYFTRIGTPEFNRTLIQKEVDLSKTLSEVDYFQALRNVYSQIAEQDVADPITSKINQDIWIADSRETQFDRVYQPGFPLNNALPNSVCSLSPDDHTLIIINHFARDGSMFKGFSFIERRPDGAFSFPDPMFIHDFYSYSAEVNLSMSKDGDVILLSLNRKEGKGDNDLYVSFKLKANLWSEPINLGPDVNTIHRELTPFLSEDKTKLFFASNRPGGIGGTDIYVTDRMDYTWKKWSTPSLLPEPINSAFDDSNPVILEPDSKMYFISRRDGTSDIFRTDLFPVSLIDRPITLKGSIRNSITNEIISSEITYGLHRLPDKDHKVQILPNGVFEVKLDHSEIYKLSPKKTGFVGKNQLVDVSILAQSSVSAYQIDFFLTPLEYDQKIEVENIYFERGKPIVVAQSFPEIDRLGDLLIQNPNISIRIEGHTDSVGNSIQLLDLSRDRAEVIKKYLVLHKSIGAHRIGTVGYGGTRPISPNDSEAHRSKNRRVEIYITTSSNLKKKLTIENLKDPIVKPTSDINESVQAGTSNMHSVPSARNNLSNAVNEIGVLNAPESKLYGNIQFKLNELSIKDSSFLEIRKLIDYLTVNTNQRIRLQGMCTDSETPLNPTLFATQRARGIKEYLIFKAINEDRIIVQDLTDKAFSGVKVYLEN